jgi:hypothetical protein
MEIRLPVQESHTAQMGAWLVRVGQTVQSSLNGDQQERMG